MPCCDITEVLKLTIGNDDRVTGYSLSKLSCGAAVGGDTSILEWVRGRKVDEVLGATVEGVLKDNSFSNGRDEFLTRKHLESVQKGLAAVLGRADASAGDLCAIESINYGPEGLEATAYLRSNLDTADIEGCEFTCETFSCPWGK
jgi:hypothetical protein